MAGTPLYRQNEAGTLWVPLSGVGPSIPAATATVDPGDPVVDAADWMTHPKFFPPAGKVIWGLFVSAPSSRVDIDARMNLASRFNTVYGGTDLGTGQAQAQAWLDKGVVPRLDYQFSRVFGRNGYADVSNVGGGKSLFRAMADGDFDADGTTPTGRAYKGLRSRYAALSQLRKGACPTNRIAHTLVHEIDLVNEGGGEGGRRSGTAAEFVAMWRHCRDVATAQGATNLVWMLNFAFASNRPDSDPYSWTKLHPGDDAVDWILHDPYNSFGSRDATWRSFSNIMNEKWGQMDWYDRRYSADPTAGKPWKPLGLGEFGTTESSGAPLAAGNDGAKWLRDMATWLAGPSNGSSSRRKVSMVTYFDKFYDIQDNTLDGNGNKGGPGNGSAGTPQKWAGLNRLGDHGVWARTALDRPVTA